MSSTPVSIADLIFQQAIRGELGELAMDGRMLSVLLSLDGRKTLADISNQFGVDLETISSVVAKLVKLQLVERIEIAEPVVDQDFMSTLVSKLSLALGPLGPIMVEDALDDLDCEADALPVAQCAELVNLLAEDIQREDKRMEFKQSMLRKIRQKGY